MTAPVRVRPRHARPTLDAAAGMFLACWHARTPTSCRPTSVPVYDESGARAMWRRIFATAEGVLVADVAGRGVCGVTRSAPIRTPTGHAPSGTSSACTCTRTPRGWGSAGRCWTPRPSRLRAAGFREATLWVFAANAGARGFYERLGWRPDGGTRVEEAYGEPELRLRRDLTAASWSRGSWSQGSWSQGS